ncbi:hypothetical protein [Duganella hordei]|uniref:hypothetical protein n=1 Tax=Duganella hordei TaxID=2865934 RepID=UPI0030E95277
MKNSLPEAIYIILGILVLCVGGVAYTTEIIGTKELVAPVLSLFGTFCGALFAFRLNQVKEEKKLHSNRQEALNRACFSLARQANAVRQLKNSFEEIQDPILRALQLPALKPPKYDSLSLNISELDFLLETEHRVTLFKLAIEFERFHAAIESINIRNEFYVKEFQPRLAEVGLNRKLATADEFEKLLGERIYGTVMHGTHNAFEQLKASDKSIREMADDLIKTAKAIYPGKEFINFKMPGDEGVKVEAAV